jgi:hypothetical protein
MVPGNGSTLYFIVYTFSGSDTMNSMPNNMNEFGADRKKLLCILISL